MVFGQYNDGCLVCASIDWCLIIPYPIQQKGRRLGYAVLKWTPPLHPAIPHPANPGPALRNPRSRTLRSRTPQPRFSDSRLLQTRIKHYICS